MSIRKMRTIQPDNLQTSFVQDYAKEAIDQLQRKDIIDGVIVSRISLVSGVDKVINHGLGRQWIGWIVTRRSANATVYESSTVSSAPKNTIILQSSANVTIDLWVF